LERCRSQFPGLLIRSGIELSEGHHHPAAVADLLARGFDRVVGSVHSLPDLKEPGRRLEAGAAYSQRDPVAVVRAYLVEAEEMAASDAPFHVLGHIDYALRHWPPGAGPVPWEALEEQVRETLTVLARSGRALEVNTSLPMDLRFLRWWHEVGGSAVAFGSDAHSPGELAQRFHEVSTAVADRGFRAASDPTALWARC